MRLKSLALAAAFWAVPATAWAHGGGNLEPDQLWASWHLAAGPLLAVGIAAAGYALGLSRIWHRGGRHRVVSGARAASFGLGLSILLLALVSPLDALAGALFSAHMVQHLLLLLVVPPLLVGGVPALSLFWVLPPERRKRVGRWWSAHPPARRLFDLLMRPGIVWVVNAAALWFWHLPGPYEAAESAPWIHLLEHTSFLLPAVAFWWLVVQPLGRRRLELGPVQLFLFTMALQGAALGALLTFARTPWYPVHAGSTVAWGLTPMEDQQLAGLLMWIPAGIVYLGAAAVAFVRWLEPHGSAAGRPVTALAVSPAPASPK